MISANSIAFDPNDRGYKQV